MSWLSSFLHPGKGYDKAQEQLDKYWGQSQNYYNQGQGYLQPYNEYGQKAYGDINTAMQKLLNPEALQNEWIKNYSESPAAKQAEGLAQEHGLNAASGLGLMGSGTALDAIQSGTSQIALNDRQNYLDNLMQKYLAGVGIGQDIFGKGAGAAGQESQNAMGMGNNAMTMGQNAAQLAYGKQNAGGNLFQNLLNTGLNLGTSYLTGGMGKGGFGRGAWSTGGG